MKGFTISLNFFDCVETIEAPSATPSKVQNLRCVEIEANAIVAQWDTKPNVNVYTLQFAKCTDNAGSILDVADEGGNFITVFQGAQTCFKGEYIWR